MKRLVRTLAAACLAVLVTVPLASADTRMFVGFQDDPSFRWSPDRQLNLDRAREANASIIRAIVVWKDVAPTRPATPSDPFDPVYRLDDVDELVRNAQARGMEVLLSIWGTPRWANGGKTPNYAPLRMSDLTAFARALASRYSGRYAGYPYVRFYSVWNESNLQLFLAPQIDAKGRIVSPRIYAKLYAAAYAGIKAGNRNALVAIGETSAHGRDRKLKGKSDTVRPGTFARLLAAANPRLKFDAWAHHPYPLPQNMPPTQKVLWPNVTLLSLPRFEKSLDAWFKRRNIPIWITEYGHESKPEEPRGVTRAKQAAYAAQALAIAKKDPRVDMFIWFVFRDDETSAWQSGLYTLGNGPKPAYARFRAAAAPLDIRNPYVLAKAGRPVSVRFSVRELAATNVVGATIGSTFQVSQGASPVSASQPAFTLGFDPWVTVPLGFAAQAGKTYTVRIVFNDVNGNELTRTATVVGVR